jgi:hypothetical protein
MGFEAEDHSGEGVISLYDLGMGSRGKAGSGLLGIE